METEWKWNGNEMKLQWLKEKLNWNEKGITLGARSFLRQDQSHKATISEVRSGKERRERERRGEKSPGCTRQLIDLNTPIDLN